MPIVKKIADQEYVNEALASYTETDPTVPAWAKAASKPTYTAKEVGALAKEDLQGSIDDALAQAKDSGEFDGDPGAPGVTPHIGSNGNWYIGSADTGVKAQGKDGDAGRGIKSIARTSGNGAAGTTDTYTITYTDNSTSTLTVYNGKNGTNGKTPVKGTDYFTDADKEEFLSEMDAVRYSEQTLTEAQKAQARANIGASGIHSTWENIDYEEVTGGNIRISRTVLTHSPGKYLEVVVDKYSQLKVTGYQWDPGSGFALCSFYDSEQNNISSVKLTAGTKYTDYLVDVPVNAFTVTVNGMVGYDMGVKGLKKYDCETLAEEKANRIAKWVALNMEVKANTIISANGKSEISQTNGELGIVDVSKYQKVIVTGYQWDLTYGFDVCCFYDVSGNLISSHQGTTNKSKAVLNLDVPNDAVTLKVSGNIYNAKVEVRGYQMFDVEDMYESLKPNGKKLITLGDSITALGTGSTGWVKYFLEKTDCELVANVAVNGAWLNDKDGTTYDGNPVFNGSDNNVNNVLGNQVQKIINNNYSAPDIIIIAIGTNNGISITKDQIKAVYYDSSNTLIPLENVDRKTSAGAYRWCLEKLHEKYPNALIFWCTPIMGFQTTRSAENAMAYAESLRIATEFTGQIMIDTIRCGINGVNEKKDANGQYLVDGLHPNVNGAKKIGYYNAAKVIPFLGNAFTLT